MPLTKHFTCYSSDDLVNWKFEGYPLTGEPNGWVGRMGVVYNENAEKICVNFSICTGYGLGGK